MEDREFQEPLHVLPVMPSGERSPQRDLRASTDDERKKDRSVRPLLFQRYCYSRDQGGGNNQNSDCVKKRWKGERPAEPIYAAQTDDDESNNSESVEEAANVVHAIW